MSGFLSRWSQRKLAERRGDEAPPEPESPAPAPEAGAIAEVTDPPAPPAPPPEPEAPFDLSSLPPLETLTASSDFSGFLRAGVPEAIRTAALRRMWVVDPLIRDYRSPLDYGWDFNTPGGLPAGFADALGEAADKVKELLRQAVGEAPEAEEPAEAPSVTMAEAPEIAHEEEVAALPASEPPAEDATPTPALQDCNQDPLVPKRRHGRALPS